MTSRNSLVAYHALNVASNVITLHPSLIIFRYIRFLDHCFSRFNANFINSHTETYKY